MIAAANLVELFRQAEREHWGYIWGEAGNVWTQAKQDASTRGMTVQYGSKWIGCRVADCSGLFVWAYRQHGQKIYHGSNTIYNSYTSETGALYGEVKILPGTAVFQNEEGRRTHIGLYAGNGKVIEARGTKTGVIESDLSEWDEWGKLKAVDYSGVQADVLVINTFDTLRQGDKGPMVEQLQELLLTAGYAVGDKGADGVYGKATKTAVEQFQRDHGLTADGIAGKKTFAELTTQTEKETEPVEPPEEDEPLDDEPTLEEKVDILWKWMKSIVAE